MGIITKLRVMFAKKPEVKTAIQEDIDEHIRTARGEIMLNNAIEHERKVFLYG